MVLPRGTKHKEAARILRQHQDLFNGAATGADCTAGATGGHSKPDETIKLYRDAVIGLHPVYWSYQKEEAIQSFCVNVEQHAMLIAPQCTLLRDQMGTYEAKKKGDRTEYNGIGPDDVMTAALGAWLGKKRGWTPTNGRATADIAQTL